MLSRKIFKVLFFALVLLSAIKANAQDEKLKAIFIYNFTRYIGWPVKEGDFVILVLGKSSVTPELSDIALKKRVGNTPIEVRSINSPQEITDCHIVYVTASKSDLISSVLTSSKSKGILIISEKDGACKKGAGINFINNDGKLGFEIARTNLSNSRLTVSTALLALGTLAEE